MESIEIKEGNSGEFGFDKSSEEILIISKLLNVSVEEFENILVKNSKKEKLKLFL